MAIDVDEPGSEERNGAGTPAAEALVLAGRYEEALAALDDSSAVDGFISQRPWDERSPGLLAAAVRRFTTSETILRDLAGYVRHEPGNATVLRTLRDVLDAEPGNHRVREIAARSLLEAGRIDDALRLIDEASDGVTEPGLASARAELLLLRDRVDEAIADLERVGGADAVELFVTGHAWDEHGVRLGEAALALYPDSEKILEALVQTYSFSLQPADLDALVEREPANVAARVARARELVEDGRLGEAERLAEAAPDPSRPLLAELTAELRLLGGRHEDALDVLTRAGGLDLVESFVGRRPWDDATVPFVTAALRRHGESADLLDDLDRYLASRSERGRLADICGELIASGAVSGLILGRRIEVLRELGRLREAEAALGQVPPQLADDPPVRAERVALQLARGDYEEATAHFAHLHTETLRQELARLRAVDDVAAAARLAAAFLDHGQAHGELLSDAAWFFLGEGALRTAIDCFERALVLDGTDLASREGLSVAYRMAGRASDAKQLCDEALGGMADDDPGRPALLAQIGWVHLERNELGLAIEAADQARTGAQGGYAVALKLRALQRAGRLQEAALLAEEAADAFPRDYDVAQQVGALAITRNDYSAAEAAFRLAVELAEESARSPAVAQFELGNGLLDLRRYEEAVDAYQRAGEREPGFIGAHFNEGHVLWTRGRYAHGRTAWKEALGAQRLAERRLGEYSSPEILAAIGAMLLETEADFESAEAYLERALAVEPERVDALITLVEVRLERHQNAKVAVEGGGGRRGPEAADHMEPDEAARMYWSAREAHARCERVLVALLERGATLELQLQLGRLHIAMEEYAKAEQVLKPLVGAQAYRSELHGQLGLVYSRQGRFRRAVDEFEQALRADPGSITTRTNLAEACRKSGSLDAAEEHYRAVLRMAPGHVEARIGLAELHIAQAEELKDTDLYEQAVGGYVAALALAGSDRGSKAMRRGEAVLRPRELADCLYSCAYARVKQHETSGLLSDSALLRDALKDFRACLAVDPSHHKAERAIEKLQERFGRFRPQWVEEKLGPSMVVVLAVAVFVLAQASFFFSTPVEDLSEALYIPMTLGALLFVTAGLVLPRVLRLKVGGIELEKTAVSQVSAPSSLGIGR